MDGLNQYGIDKSVGISMANKSLENDINLISNGEYIFILHSPERLQTSRYGCSKKFKSVKSSQSCGIR